MARKGTGCIWYGLSGQLGGYLSSLLVFQATTWHGYLGEPSRSDYCRADAQQRKRTGITGCVTASSYAATAQRFDLPAASAAEPVRSSNIRTGHAR